MKVSKQVKIIQEYIHDTPMSHFYCLTLQMWHKETTGTKPVSVFDDLCVLLELYTYCTVVGIETQFGSFIEKKSLLLIKV